MVSRPKREPDVIQGVVEGSLALLRCFDCRISEPQWWKNKGLLGSQSTGRRITRLAGKPKQRRWAKSRKEGSDARASRRCPRAPGAGDSSDAAPSTVGAKSIHVQNTCALPAAAAAAAVATAWVCQGAELPPRRPLRSPGVCGGRGGAAAAPVRLLLLLLSAAG